jgi:hypothetical protein
VERDEQVRSQESGHAFNDSTAAETHRLLPSHLWGPTSLDRFSVNRTIARQLAAHLHDGLGHDGLGDGRATRGTRGCSLLVRTMRTAPAGKATRVRCDEEDGLAGATATMGRMFGARVRTRLEPL